MQIVVGHHVTVIRLQTSRITWQTMRPVTCLTTRSQGVLKDFRSRALFSTKEGPLHKLEFSPATRLDCRNERLGLPVISAPVMLMHEDQRCQLGEIMIVVVDCYRSRVYC